MSEKRTKNVFVTVGTTLFEDLVGEFDSGSEVLRILKEAGFNRVVVQYGNGKAPRPDSDGFVEAYKFKPSLKVDLEEASLVISHAGAGSILEALGLYKPLLVVVNEALLHNHQTELAEELSEQGYLVATNVRGLAAALTNEVLNPDGKLRTAGLLQRLPEASPSLFRDLLADEMADS